MFLPQPRRAVRPAVALALSALIAGPVLAACGTSTAPDGTKAAPATIEDTAAPTTAAPTTAAPRTAVPTATAVPARKAPLPAVAGATNLTKQPVPAAGTGAPPTVLEAKDLVVGTGTTATQQSTVSVQYVGTLWTTGAKFDASWDNNKGQPLDFPLTGVIPGFQQGIAGMKVGGRRELVIPPALGYGDQANTKIPANSTLVFVVDLKAVK